MKYSKHRPYLYDFVNGKTYIVIIQFYVNYNPTFTLTLNSYLVIQLLVFQIIVGSCSALIKEESENPKVAENLTVYLPDFSSGAIKSLLCLMYTGNESTTTSCGLICTLLFTSKI